MQTVDYLNTYILAIEGEEDRAFFERLYEVYCSGMKLYACSVDRACCIAESEPDRYSHGSVGQ